MWTKKPGRNDECFCGSGKKYKKCCMLKEDAVIPIKKKEQNTIFDEYITKYKYVKEVGYPLTHYDYLVLELINLAGHIIDEYKCINREATERILMKIAKSLKEAEGIIKDCKKDVKEERGTAIDLEEGVNFEELGVEDYVLEILPKNIRTETVINYWYLQIIRSFGSIVPEELSKMIGEEKASSIGGHVYVEIMEYISLNCREKCKDKCIKRMEESGYCKICQMGKERYRCPKYGEISYKEIKATEKDMDEHKN